MALVLTRRPGESIIVRRHTPEGWIVGRLYVVGVEGNVVRLGFDMPIQVEILREELLDLESDQRYLAAMRELRDSRPPGPRNGDRPIGARVRGPR